jgi:hypothetical protein
VPTESPTCQFQGEHCKYGSRKANTEYVRELCAIIGQKLKPHRCKFGEWNMDFYLRIQTE